MAFVELEENRCGEYSFGGVEISPNLTKDVSSETQREAKSHVNLSRTKRPAPREQRASAQFGADLLLIGGGPKSDLFAAKNRTNSERKYA